jgi:hypothetical protein
VRPSPLGTSATIGLLYQPRMMMMMMMSVEQSVAWELAGETEVLGESLPQRHFVHHKSHMTLAGIEPGPPRWEARDYPPRQHSHSEVKLSRGLIN